MKNKKNSVAILIILVVFVLAIIVYYFSVFFAPNSSVGYDSKLIWQFLIRDHVYILVDIKDTTNITIPKVSSPDFESTLKERNAIMIELTDAVFSTLSENEFQLERKSEFGGYFSGNITKRGFNKLLKDERVKHIYAEKILSGN